jgi:predicted dehydrogenase
MSGVIGNVLSVDFHWLLDTRHGADYFRRWHRNKKNSGGLMVHKATHHFDLVNWWLSTVPRSVVARGQRRFYVPQTAKRYGLNGRGERCLECSETAGCPFFLDLKSNDGLRKLYLDNERFDGYQRDRCVFSDTIDIEDSMNAIVSYDTGAVMTYSLNAFMPWEGYVVNFNGTRGRLEHVCQESAYINADGSVPGALKKEGTTIKVFPHFKPAYAVDVWTGAGGHGGGDQPLLTDLFDPEAPEDKYKRAADQRSGAWSIMTGVAANHSMAEGREVTVRELVGEVPLPDYPAMPTPKDPLPGREEAAMR